MPMTRAMQLMTGLCAASLLGNVWLYRELKVRERDDSHAVASIIPETQTVVPNVNAGVAPQAATAAAELSKPKAQTGDKCRKKLEDAMLNQLRDPKRCRMHSKKRPF